MVAKMVAYETLHAMSLSFEHLFELTGVPYSFTGPPCCLLRLWTPSEGTEIWRFLFLFYFCGRDGTASPRPLQLTPTRTGMPTVSWQLGLQFLPYFVSKEKKLGNNSVSANVHSHALQSQKPKQLL